MKLAIAILALVAFIDYRVATYEISAAADREVRRRARWWDSIDGDNPTRA